MTKITPKTWTVSLVNSETGETFYVGDSFSKVLSRLAVTHRYFDLCVTYTRMSHPGTGTIYYQFACKRGLWMVEGQDKEKARAEATNYFLQYFDDGEYDQLIRSAKKEDAKN